LEGLGASFQGAKPTKAPRGDWTELSTVFIRLYAAAYKVFFIISCGLQSGTAYIFYFLLYRNVYMTLSLSLATFFDQILLSHSIFFNITCTSVTGGIMINRRQLWSKHD